MNPLLVGRSKSSVHGIDTNTEYMASAANFLLDTLEKLPKHSPLIALAFESAKALVKFDKDGS